jgi:hypothetical protein
MAPIDHTSHFDVYLTRLRISGDIYFGVPTTLFWSAVSDMTYLAKPKSASLTLPP